MLSFLYELFSRFQLYFTEIWGVTNGKQNLFDRLFFYMNYFNEICLLFLRFIFDLLTILNNFSIGCDFFR
ncbi:hypothetical protein M153_4810005699 [Pseudoloma neurophilia]|uniref:Uncharacterized protein n=1 Tax=Pseudoloma neurophilia TaxID=146866 RepID=A0A0R0M4X3_9MICR|nr:hypothetical protein M153_4810005699 [Pseudoloma neurophilia]